MSWLLFIVLIILILGVVPRWGYSRDWGYGPSGFLGLALVVLVVLVLTKTIHL